jgi:hypothetical protein
MFEGHVTCRRTMINAQKMFVGKPERKRLLLRPK